MTPAVDEPPSLGPACCGSASACIFDKALLAQAAVCELAQRRERAEGVLLECPSPTARINCETLAALMRERAQFAMRLPAPGRPLIHMQALRLQCGGAAALQQMLGCPGRDMHRMVGAAQEIHGSLMDLPWLALVEALVAWQPARRGGRRG